MKIKGCKQSSFLDQAIKNGGQSIFYVLKCWDKEKFYKLWIIVNHILTRYGSVKAMPYEWSILLELPATAEEVYAMEVQFKTDMEALYYEPKIKFNGSKTECYSEISEALQHLIQLN